MLTTTFQAGSPGWDEWSALQIAESDVKCCYSYSFRNMRGNLFVLLQPMACCPLLPISSRTRKHQRGLRPQFYAWSSAGQKKTSCAGVREESRKTKGTPALAFCESIYPHRENMESRKKKKDSPHSHHLNTSTVSILEYFLLFFFKRSGVLVVCSRKSTQRIWNMLMMP